MTEQELRERLSIMNTRWSLLLQAHGADQDEAVNARAELVQRYSGAVYRYLLAGVRDPDVAADLSQEFAVRFLEGRFHRADASRGRFRDYLKTCLFHLVGDYRRRGKQPRPGPLGDNEPVAAEAPPEEEQAFRDIWREELLQRTWLALEQVEKETGQPYFLFLRFRVDHPDLSSQQMAEQLSARVGKPLTAGGVRQTLHRGRERFAELLLEEVRRSLGPGGADYLADELIDLNLLKYCQDALNRS